MVVINDKKQRWEFIKENQKDKKKENTLRSRKGPRKKGKKGDGQEKKKENTLSTKKARKKRQRSRKKKEGNGKRKLELNI